MKDYLPLIDNHATLKPGQAIRLFPFGVLQKGGEERELTPEMLGKFKLPDFKPPIKIGSHADEAPAGGYLTGLEIRDDGLYALTEFTEKGAKALEDGDYRYHSPEVVWDGMLDGKDGPMEGPLILGTALIHMPHLGEAAALFEAVPQTRGEDNMTTSEDMVSVPATLWERFLAHFDRDEIQPEPEPEDTIDTEEYAAIVSERDGLQAQLGELMAAQEDQARREKFEAELEDTKLAGLDGGAEMLASMTDEQAGWVMQQIRALSEQVGSELETEIGAGGDPDNVDATAALDKAVRAEMEDGEVGYNDALVKVLTKQPELYQAWQRANGLG